LSSLPSTFFLLPPGHLHPSAPFGLPQLHPTYSLPPLASPSAATPRPPPPELTRGSLRPTTPGTGGHPPPPAPAAASRSSLRPQHLPHQAPRAPMAARRTCPSSDSEQPPADQTSTAEPLTSLSGSPTATPRLSNSWWWRGQTRLSEGGREDAPERDPPWPPD
jgi:hypothetical protein